jgi:hypothetical protein
MFRYAHGAVINSKRNMFRYAHGAVINSKRNMFRYAHDAVINSKRHPQWRYRSVPKHVAFKSELLVHATEVPVHALLCGFAVPPIISTVEFHSFSEPRRINAS